MRRTIHAALGWGLLGAVVISIATSAAAGEDGITAITTRLGRRAKIVNGVLEANYPSVGALLFGSNPDTASSWCTGTMIGCRTFLTAGHCVDGYAAANFTVFLPSAGFFSVASITPHPSYSFPERDVAVLSLGAPVDGVAPSRIDAAVDPPAGTPGVIVGFGRSGGLDYDYGLKRSGAISTIDCPNLSFYSGSICWLYTTPLGPPGSNADTCNADSGGPLFVDFGSGDRVAGLTSGGSNDNCTPGDLSYDLDVYRFHTFIEGVAGADLANTACGVLPQVGSPLTSVQSASGEVDSATPEAVHTFEVAPGAALLRVAMTGTEDNSSDFDMYVRHGAAPTTSVYDCRDIGANQFNFCEFSAPASGTWYVMARRVSGFGQYQITATAFERDCSLPANEGLGCDDGEICTSGDVCSAGVCAGTPVADGAPCDDGNSCTDPDSCQSGACAGAPLPGGTACDDGNPCSSPDVCQAGVCAGAAPATSCKAPFLAGRSLLQLEDRSPDSGDRLVWKWLRGAQTSKQEFGDPTSSTDYWLCAYDQTGGVSHRIIEQKIPAGSRWLDIGNGFQYRDTDVAQGGIYSALLKEGGDGTARIIVRGKAQPLGMPPLGLDQDPAVIVQLLNDTTCWEADYGSNLRNDTTEFKARAD